jgi:hypothetical protein
MNKIEEFFFSPRLWLFIYIWTKINCNKQQQQQHNNNNKQTNKR